MNKNNIMTGLKCAAVGGAIGAIIGQLHINRVLQKELDELSKITGSSIKQTEDALDIAEGYKNLYEEREAKDTELIEKTKELIDFLNDAEGKES